VIHVIEIQLQGFQLFSSFYTLFQDMYVKQIIFRIKIGMMLLFTFWWSDVKHLVLYYPPQLVNTSVTLWNHYITLVPRFVDLFFSTTNSFVKKCTSQYHYFLLFLYKYLVLWIWFIDMTANEMLTTHKQNWKIGCCFPWYNAIRTKIKNDIDGNWVESSWTLESWRHWSWPLPFPQL
jgi:hypothetical protein